MGGEFEAFWRIYLSCFHTITGVRLCVMGCVDTFQMYDLPFVVLTAGGDIGHCWSILHWSNSLGRFRRKPFGAGAQDCDRGSHAAFLWVAYDACTLSRFTHDTLMACS